jgi:hypothetical protein
MAYDRHVLQGEHLHDAPDGVGMLEDSQANRAVETAVAGAHQVDDVTANMRRQMGKELAERRSRDRPPVDEEHIRP